jgi:hypothetical protein
MQTTRTKGGCGCGGGGGCGCGGGCSGGCGCKPAKLPEAVTAPCSPCETSSFVRPRFFAGQLLTEDDLGSLIDYVVAKNRFHNARLFGAGVVCGLLVECGPCNSTKIVVQPGYALDCCGNDLVLTCEQTLDIAPMIRELAARKGKDCTDPCTEAKAADTKANTTGTAAGQGRTEHYCLYARYAERSDQPVAAYPVGQDCDAASCEPTRILEGIAFELRCGKGPRPRTVKDAIEECRLKIDEKGEASGRAVDLQWLSQRVLASYARATPAYDVDEVRVMAEASQADYEATFKGLTGPARISALTRFIPETYGRFLRHTLLKAELPESVDREKLQAHAKRAVGELYDSDLATVTPLEAEMARAVISAYQISTDAKPDTRSAVLNAFLSGGIVSPQIMEVARTEIEDLATKLKREFGCGTGKIHTDCTLPELIDQLQPGWASKAEKVDVIKFGQQAAASADTIRRLIEIDCSCAAVNPPCPTCDDTGVLLACFEVENCKVTKICNTVRQYVLAPRSLRYWDILKTPHPAICCGEPRVVRPPTRFPFGTLEVSPQLYGRVEAALATPTEANFQRMEMMRAPSATLAEIVGRPVVSVEDDIRELKRRLAAAEEQLATRQPSPSTSATTRKKDHT